MKSKSYYLSLLIRLHMQLHNTYLASFTITCITWRNASDSTLPPQIVMYYLFFYVATPPPSPSSISPPPQRQRQRSPQQQVQQPQIRQPQQLQKPAAVLGQIKRERQTSPDVAPNSGLLLFNGALSCTLCKKIIHLRAKRSLLKSGTKKFHPPVC